MKINDTGPHILTRSEELQRIAARLEDLAGYFSLHEREQESLLRFAAAAVASAAKLTPDEPAKIKAAIINHDFPTQWTINPQNN